LTIDAVNKRTADVIVIGLGAVGSATVYQLASGGCAVFGIDQFDPPHELGSTHGETRITRQVIGEGAHYTPLAIRSHDLWREIEQETGRTLLTQCGGLIISAPTTDATCHVPAFFENTVAAARAHGIAHELMDAAEVMRRYPHFRLRGDESAYYERGAGFVRPEECVRANLDIAARHGAVLHTNEKVLSLLQRGEGVEIRTDRATYNAGRVVLSAGPWVQELLGNVAGACFQVTRQVQYWFELRSNTARFDPSRCPVYICQLAGLEQPFYGFPAVASPEAGVKVATEYFASTTTANSVNRTVTPEEIAKMYQECVEPFLPDLGPRCLKTITCLYTSTPDSGFVIDVHPDHPSILVASPCSGHGFKHSAAIGEAIAQTILLGHSRLDLSAFSFRRSTLL
jgi:sarcosine oxidase